MGREHTPNHLDPKTDLIYHVNIPALLYSKFFSKIKGNWAFFRISFKFLAGINDMDLNPITLSSINGILNGEGANYMGTVKEKIRHLQQFTGIGQDVNYIPDNLGLLTVINNMTGPRIEINDGAKNIKELMRIKSIGG